MRYKIPQDVQREDTIVGPVTFMQLAITLVGGGLTYVMYLFFASQGIGIAVWLPVVVVMTAITLTVAFVKIFDMKFYVFFFYMVEYVFKPKKRTWFKEKDEFYFSVFQKVPELNSEQVKKVEPKKTNREQLEEISKKLDQ